MTKPLMIELQQLRDGEADTLSKASNITITEEASEEPSSRQEEQTKLLQPNRHDQVKNSNKPAGKIFGSFQGWRGGLLLVATADVLTSLLVLAFLLFTAFGTRRAGMEATLFEGDCKKTKLYSTLTHLVINILSTTLLASSSYTMQLLTSPTRADVTKAHSQGKYITIGVSSLRNLFHFSKRRALLYFALAATSIPIHLLANSAVYVSQSTNSYFMFVVNYDYTLQRLTGRISDAQLNRDLKNELGPYLSPTAYNVNNDTMLLTAFKHVYWNASELDLDECIRAYSQPFVTGFRHVLVVTDQFSNTSRGSVVGSSILDVEAKLMTIAIDEGYGDPTNWTCSFDRIGHQRVCDANGVLQKLNPPHVGPDLQYTVKSCIAERVAANCKLQSSLLITIIVLVCAFCKSALLFVTLKTLSGPLLATLGDAIAFFLEVPDHSTIECSLLSRKEVKKSLTTGRFIRKSQSSTRRWQPGQPHPARWGEQGLTERWINAIPGWTIILTLAFVIPICGFLFYVIESTRDKASTIRDTGFGNANLNYIIRLPNQNNTLNLVEKAILVNLPQFVLSCYYFCYNQCWSYLFISSEWARFAAAPQHLPLRVSEPEGHQKSKYFLSIPYRYSLPLLVFSAALHWLASQSLFLVMIDVKYGEPFMPDATSTLSAVGYSRTAVLVLSLIFAKLILVPACVAIRGKMWSPIPLVGGCSLAISAGCHPPEDDGQCWLKPLKWGVIDSMEKDGFLHCAFTSGDTYSPERLEREGPRYGGKRQTVAWFK